MKLLSIEKLLYRGFCKTYQKVFLAKQHQMNVPCMLCSSERSRHLLRVLPESSLKLNALAIGKSNSICVPISGLIAVGCHGFGDGDDDAQDDTERTLSTDGE